MRRAAHRSRRNLRAIAATAAVVAIPMALPATMLSSASAAGLLPSTTTLAASPTSATQPANITLTATVSVLGLPGLGLTPSGTVSFSDGGSIGTGTISGCLLTTCTTSLTTSSSNLPVGTSTVTATFAGDLLAASSSGTASLTVIAPAPKGTPDNPFVTTCPGGDCNTGTLSDAAGDTSADVDTSSQSGVTIDSSFGGAALPCGIPGAGQVTTVNESANGGVKTITVTVTGAAAAAFGSWVNNEGDTEWVCYDANTDFSGFFSPDGTYPDNHQGFTESGLVPQVTSGPYAGTYAGLLATCGSSFAPTPPCYQNWSRSVNGSGTTTSVTYQVVSPAGDPHLGGGG
jgi:large repetitive protein